MKRILLLVGLWPAVACAFATAVSAALLANPGFESGDLSGWSTIDAGAGAWAVNDGSELPGSEYTLAPAEGRYDAAWDMEFVSGGVLYQDVAVPAAGGGVSFSYAYVNDADGWA
ncbi:MAG: hypothetical protein ACXVZ1_05200, partial [Gaiellaceae bacterium]